jgi:hypothetical protein
MGGFVLGGIIAGAFSEPVPPKTHPEPGLWALSDGLYVLQLAAPVPAFSVGHSGTNFGGALFIYAEALTAGYFVNNLARPFDGGTRASLAFAGAVSASYLFAEAPSAPDGLKASFWATEVALASASSVLRYRGSHPSRRSFTLLIAESVLGTGIGVGAYAASNGDPSRVLKAGQGVGFLIGLGVGQILGWWVTPLESGNHPVLASLEVAPFAQDKPGLAVSGRW